MYLKEIFTRKIFNFKFFLIAK